jgi:DNA-binding NtrC family response regulator
MVKKFNSVLLVTEDPMLIKQLNSILQNQDYSVIIEDSKIKSILKILENDVSLIMIDIDMPMNSHIDLIMIIKKTRPRVPIITFSTDTSLDTLRKFVQAGVFYCALKPIRYQELEQVIEKVVHFK